MLTDRKRRLTAFMVAIAVLIATPLVVMAADAFDDVPNSNVHHDDITWLKDNGVTAGCNPPANTEFCPGDPVLRQQMASFMRRLAENEVVNAATAVEAENSAMLGGIGADEFLQAGTVRTTIGGSQWQAWNTTNANRFISGTEFDGNGAAVLGLIGPKEIGGHSYGLAELRICYRAPNTGFITEISVYRTNPDASADPVFIDGTDRTADSECIVVSPGVAAEEGLGVYVDLSGGGTVRLEGATATWSSGVSLQTQGIEDDDPARNGN